MQLAEAVENYLSGRINGFRRLVSCDRLSGGASQETHRVEIETDQCTRLLAFRRAPGGGDPGVDRTGPGLDVEAALMQLARQAGVPEPEVVAVLDGSEGMGPGFFMDWLEGEALGARIARSDAFEGTRPILARQCGEILARIHALDVHAAGIADRLERWTPESYIRELWQDYQAFGTPQPMIDYAARWMLANLPDTDRVTLVHNDFRNGNLMIRPGTGVVAVLDWEVATLGDPMRDLGWICTNSWRFGVSHLPVGGFGTYDDLFAGYEAVSGQPVNRDHVHFWEVFGSFWWAVGCLRMAERWRNGPDRTVERPGIARRTSECQVDCVNLIIPGPPGVHVEGNGSDDINMPRTDELTTSVRDFLRADVMGATEGRTSFLARVAANSLDIVLRDAALGPESRRLEHESLKRVLGRDGSRSELLQVLVDGLRDGSMALDHPGLAMHLRESVIRQVAIDQPVYSGYKNAMEFSAS
ncbi:MAG: phosphotransferase [Minwuia sp.]|nr:phosphotransferase [Minwuia sp.]